MKYQKAKTSRNRSSEEVKAKVIKALEDNRWDYRTAEGISKAVSVRVDLVKGVLNSDKRIRHSVMKSKSGKDLYTLKHRRSVIRDFYTAFRAMNAEKLGDS
ncbi:hypothetical protein [Shewanella phaeophyticola]|uniref:Transposase n=1 Tax=Shewanella phaeophyticola TaxID=2978345 RepID=A0ABT2P1K9_9GAMM|nr:hypothetical protein [Shewanella sp. KJ10-1]MCT8986347.1 hypothetical protein [Shewanella sp. KJ10-1]